MWRNGSFVPDFFNARSAGASGTDASSRGDYSKAIMLVGRL